MKRHGWLSLGLPLLSVALIAALPTEAQPPAATPQHFDKHIAPLLANRCLDCHSGAKPRGGLDLTRRQTALAGGDSGPALVPGKAADSLAWQHVQSGKMPPKKPLTAAEKQLLKQW